MEATQAPHKDAEKTVKATVIEDHAPHKIEEKTTGNYYLPEAQRLIKAVIILFEKNSGSNRPLGIPKKGVYVVRKAYF